MKLRRAYILGVLSSSACAWWMAGRPGIGGGDRITFNHQLHLTTGGAKCQDCHAGVEEATSTAVQHDATEEACLECHEREDDCQTCHSEPELARTFAPRHSEIGFSHAAHIPRATDGCATCHAELIAATSLPPPRPTMDLCLKCHEHATDYAEARCQHCHPTMRELPLRAIAEFDHSGNFMSRHGMLARSASASCMQCHTESTCTECHSRVALAPPAAPARLFPEEVARTLLHRGDFAATHAIEARADGDTCTRCHASQSCVSCHRSVGLAEDGTDPRSPHPAGYAMPGGGTAFHGDDARRRVETCAACHEQGAASNCVDCHAVGGVGGNPHPPRFADRHPQSEIAGNDTCLICHE